MGGGEVKTGIDRIKELRDEGFSAQVAKKIEKGESYKLRLAEANHAQLVVILCELVDDMYPPRHEYRYPV